MATSPAPRIVMLGGGTGTFTVLSALKHYARDLTAIVNMVDDGGSTGVLRDELGTLPPGDVRQSLVALSNSSQELRKLFNYRFTEGSLSGHAFGNLFLTALEKSTGSFSQAVKVAGEILDITGRVIPVTTDDVRLQWRRDDGTVLSGEYEIGRAHLNTKHPDLFLKPAAKLDPAATSAITAADIILIGPGSVYGSLVPILLVEGIGEILRGAPGKLVYICNLVTKPGQTDGFAVNDFADIFTPYLGGRNFDYVIYNTQRPSAEQLRRYAAEGERSVGYDPAVLSRMPYTAIGEPLVARRAAQVRAGDTIARTLIRHDANALARIIMRLFFS